MRSNHMKFFLFLKTLKLSYLLEVLFPDGLYLRGPVLLDVPDVLHLPVVVLAHALHLHRAVLPNPLGLKQ